MDYMKHVSSRCYNAILTIGKLTVDLIQNSYVISVC